MTGIKNRGGGRSATASKSDQRGGSRPRFQREDISDCMTSLIIEAIEKTGCSASTLTMFMDCESSKATAGRPAEIEGIECPELAAHFDRGVRFRPGSSQKVAVMRIRYILGIPPFHVDDVQEKPVSFNALDQGGESE